MKSIQTMTVSLPPRLVREMERVRKVEQRTRSELVQEALRTYLSRRIPTRAPSRAERSALRKGRAEFKEGAFVSFDQLQYVLGSRRRPILRKGA